jgi:hypothetical protein
MIDTSIARVRYYDQQILRTSDFVDEQAYHLAQRQRHAIGEHTWGIVYGLELVQDSNGELSVQPGMAIDGYGRELILEQYKPIERGIFDDKGSETLDVYLEYAEQTANEGPPGYSACRAGQITSNRVQETVGLVIRKPGAPQSIPDIDLPERRQPEGVPPDDLRFSPDRVPPNDPKRRWPVFLGQIRRDAETPISLGGRPYAGLRGEMVLAPSDWAWLQVGEWPDNDYRFAVFLAERDQEGDDMIPKASPRSSVEPVLGIKPAVAKTADDAETAAANAQGKPVGPTIELRADTTLSGDLIVEGGAIEFGPGLPYTSARPWRMYHVYKKNSPLDESSKDQTSVDDAVAQDQLRIEMAAPDEQGTINEVVVGHWSEEKSDFEPCLTVGADGDVTVAGNLLVNGSLLRFNKAEATDEALVRYVVRRTKKPTDNTAPAWFGALFEELGKRGLRETFLRSLLGRASKLGWLDELVVALTKPEYSASFLAALVSSTQADFVSAYLRELTKQAKTDHELDKRLSATLANLANTLTGPDFAARFWAVLAQQVKTQAIVRDALLKLILEQAKTDPAVREALLKLILEQVKTDATVRKALLERLGDLVKTDATVRKALLERLGDLVKTDADVREELLPQIVNQLKDHKPVRDALLPLIVAQVVAEQVVRDALLQLIVNQLPTEKPVRDALLQLIVNQLPTEKPVRDALLQLIVNQLPTKKPVRDALLQLIVNQLPTEKPVRDALLQLIVGQVATEQVVQAALVAAIQAHPGLAQTLCNQLVPPPPPPPSPIAPPAPAGADLQHFIDRLHDDQQFQDDFKNKNTKQEMLNALLAFPHS